MVKLFNDPNYPKGSLENPQSALGLRVALAFFGFVMFFALTIFMSIRDSNWRWLFLVLMIISGFNLDKVWAKWRVERRKNDDQED